MSRNAGQSSPNNTEGSATRMIREEFERRQAGLRQAVTDAYERIRVSRRPRDLEDLYSWMEDLDRSFREPVGREGRAAQARKDRSAPQELVADNFEVRMAALDEAVAEAVEQALRSDSGDHMSTLMVEMERCTGYAREP